MTSARLRSQFEILDRNAEGLTFHLINQFPGAGSVVSGSLTLVDREGDQTEALWLAEINSRSGLLKMIPESVLRGILEREFQKLWAGVRRELGK